MSSSDQLPAATPKGVSRIILFFRDNPWVGFIGTVASVIGLVVGIPVSIYFSFRNDRYPELTYFVSPVKAVVVGANEAEGLNITVNGEEIKNDITGVQVMVWNSGKEAIDKSSILKPLVISTDGAKILQAYVREETREDIIRTALDKSQMAKGLIKVDWNILEQDDGAIIQLVYVGSGGTSITGEATLKGQKQIKEIQRNEIVVSPSQRQSWIVQLYASTPSKVFSLIASVLILALSGYFIAADKNDRFAVKAFNRAVFVAMLLTSFVCVWSIRTSYVKLPLDFCASCGGPPTQPSQKERDPAQPLEENAKAPARSDKK